MTEHIDNTRLHNDLRYRFEYISKFLDFTQDDIKLLNQFARIILPRIPIILDNVYRNLLSFDITKKYFLLRNDGFQGHVARNSRHLTVDSPQMTFRKDMLSKYLTHLLTEQEWNDQFLHYLSHVGKIHTNEAGSSSINVDYIHINALFSYLEHLLLDILWTTTTTEDIDNKTKYLMFVAINKLFWIQNDFFTMHYMMTMDDSLPSFHITKTDQPPCCSLN